MPSEGKNPLDTLALGDLAYYWRMTELGAPANPVPSFLPFSFGFEPTTQLITQTPNPRVLDTLRQTYLLESNIGYMQEGHALADKYGLDFLAFFEEAIAERKVRRVLDLGCGGCYALKSLKDKGYQVFGLDPGPLTARWGEKLGIPVATGFYPFEHGFGPMDVVFSSGVLEHVPQPIEFLRAQKADLAPQGCIVISTPDNEPSIALGDPSMLLHEHLSYFDHDSLHRTVEAAGFRVLHSGKARYGQSLYVMAVPGTASSRAPAEGKWETFSARLEDSLKKFEAALRPLLENPQHDVGFYVPLRALPYLSHMKIFSGFRLFDDDSGTHGKCFDGFPVEVESWQQFQAKPPTHAVIMSLPHADAITQKIDKAMGSGVCVTSLRQILGARPETPWRPDAGHFVHADSEICA